MAYLQTVELKSHTNYVFNLQSNKKVINWTEWDDRTWHAAEAQKNQKPDKNKIIYQCEHQTLCHTSFGSLW